MKALRQMVPWIAAVLFLATAASPVLAATFRVSPMALDLTSKTTSTLLTITNDTTHEIRFEVTAMKWEQDERGEMQLTPAGDTIAFFPKLLSLAGGASRTIRVGTKAGAFGPTEGTYRIFVEELP